MNIINDKLIAELMEHVPKDLQPLFFKQVKKIESIISDHKESYQTDVGFRTAIDIVVKEILSGEFLDIKESN